MPLPACVRTILAACAMEELPQEASNPFRLHVGRVYLVLYTHGNRAAFQRQQLPWIGASTSLVTGYDAQEITNEHIDCMFVHDISKPSGKPVERKQLSQLIKLWAALYDMVRRDLPTGLFLEDDAVMHPGRLPGINGALPHLSPGFDILHLSSYHPVGRDSGTLQKEIECGLHRKPHGDIGGIRAGVANLLSLQGAKRMLHAVPIRAVGLDAATSNHLHCISNTSRVGYGMKPYPFTPGAFGSDSLFDCNFTTTCERAFYERWGQGRWAHFSSWVTQRVRRSATPAPALGSHAWAQPLGGGCPELLDCTATLVDDIDGSQAGNGVGLIRPLHYGAKCVQSDGPRCNVTLDAALRTGERTVNVKVRC